MTATPPQKLRVIPASSLCASNLNSSFLSVQYRTNRQVTPYTCLNCDAQSPKSQNNVPFGSRTPFPAIGEDEVEGRLFRFGAASQRR